MLQFKKKFQNKSFPYSIQSYSHHLSNHGFNRIGPVPLTVGRSSDILFRQLNIFDQSKAFRHFNAHHSYTNQNQIGHGYKTHYNHPTLLLSSTAHFSTQIDGNLSQISSTSDTNNNYTNVESDMTKTLKVADFYTSTDNQHHHNYKSITLHNTSELINYLSFCVNEDEIEFILKLLKSAGKKIKSIPKPRYIRTTSTTDDYVTETIDSTLNISSSLLSDRNKIKQPLYWVQTWIDEVFVSKTMQAYPIVVPDYSYDTSSSSTTNNGMTKTSNNDSDNNNNMHVSNLNSLKRKLANISRNNSVFNGQHIDSSSLSAISSSSQNNLNNKPIANNHLLKKQLIEVIQLYNEYNEIYSFIPRFDDSIKNIDHVINMKNIKTDPSILPHIPQPQDLALYNNITPITDDTKMNNNANNNNMPKTNTADNNNTNNNNNNNNTQQMLEIALTSFNSLSLEQSVTLLCQLYPTFILQNIYYEIIRYISSENSAIKQLNLNLRTFVGGDVDPVALYVLLNILSSCPHNYTLHIVNKKKDTKKGLVFSLEDEITINLQNLQQYYHGIKIMSKQPQKQLSASSGRKVKTVPIETIGNKVVKKAKIKIRKLKMDINKISNSNDDDETALGLTTQTTDGVNNGSVSSSSVTNKKIKKPTNLMEKSNKSVIEDNYTSDPLSASSSSSSLVKSDIKDNNKKKKQQSLLNRQKSKKQSTKASDSAGTSNNNTTSSSCSNNNNNPSNKKKSKNTTNNKKNNKKSSSSQQPPKEVLEANLFEELDRMAKNVIHRFTTKSRLNISILCTYNEYQAERECHHVGSLNDVESGINRYIDKTVNDSVYFNDNNSGSSDGDINAAVDSHVVRTIDDSDVPPSPSYSDNSSIVTANSSLQKESINFTQFVERTDDYYGRLVHRMHRNIYRQNYTGAENSGHNNTNKPRHLLNEAANFNIFTDELGVYHNSNDIEDEHLHSTNNSHNSSSNNIKDGEKEEQEEEEEDRSMYKVFVSEIPSGVSRENIINVFCKVGNVVDVVYVPNTELNREEYDDYLTTMEEEATAAAAAIDDSMGSTDMNTSDSIKNNNSLSNSQHIIQNSHEDDAITNEKQYNNEDDSVLDTVSKIISKRKNATNDPVIIQQSNQRINKLRNLINPSTSKQVPKKLIRHYRPDGHAFVFFDNKESYELAIGDDFRILGINLMGTNCYVHSAHLSTTLYIEFLQTVNTANIINIFKLIFGEQWEYTVNLSNYEDLNPMFVHLKFRTHEEAWKSYKILDAEPGIYDILHITWCKSTWYRAVAKKEKEFSYERQDNKARFDVSTNQIMTESSSLFFKKDNTTHQKENNTVDDNNREVTADNNATAAQLLGQSI